MPQLKCFLVALVGLLLSCAVLSCAGDDGSPTSSSNNSPTMQPATYHCCTIQRLCSRCTCGSERQIGSAGNESACESYLNQGDWGCYPDAYAVGTTIIRGAHYGETEALAACL
ncbi:MAG TPA: hypothetical protein VHO25_04355 [Polyangiaceae bacterium]|nr:hypothetical protein [Polyangiaceae bacterium]